MDSNPEQRTKVRGMSPRRSGRSRAAAGILAFALAGILVVAVLSIGVADNWPVFAISALLFLLALYTALLVWRRMLPLETAPVLLPLVLAAVWGAAQCWSGRTIYRYVTEMRTIELGASACVFWIALEALASSKMRTRFRHGMVAFGAIVSVIAIAQQFTAQGKILWLFQSPWTAEPIGPFLNRDYYCAFIELLLPMALWKAVGNASGSVLPNALAAAVMYGSVITSASRAGAILATLEVGAILVFTFARSKKPLNWGLVGLRLVACLLVASAVVGWDILLTRFEEKTPFASRAEFLKASVRMVRERPVDGFGLGTWPLVYPSFAVFDAGAWVNHAHDDWAEWAAEGGIPFLLLVLMVAARGAWLGFRYPPLIGIFFTAVHACVDFPLQKFPIWLSFLTLIALGEARMRRPDDRHRHRRRRSAPVEPESATHSASESLESTA
jgi:O-antigen ligase